MWSRWSISHDYPSEIPNLALLWYFKSSNFSIALPLAKHRRIIESCERTRCWHLGAPWPNSPIQLFLSQPGQFVYHLAQWSFFSVRCQPTGEDSDDMYSDQKEEGYLTVLIILLVSVDGTRTARLYLSIMKFPSIRHKIYTHLCNDINCQMTYWY